MDDASGVSRVRETRLPGSMRFEREALFGARSLPHGP